MIVAVVALSVVVAGALSLIAWLVHSSSKRTDQTIKGYDVRDELRAEVTKLTLESERAKYEAIAATAALTAERKRADALEEFISHEAFETDPSAPLAPDDVAGRLLRFSRTVAGEAAPAGDLPAGHEDLLRPEDA